MTSSLYTVQLYAYHCIRILHKTVIQVILSVNGCDQMNSILLLKLNTIKII